MKDNICMNCKYWSDEKLVLWGKERDHYRLCKKGKIKTYTFAGSSCGDEIKGYKKKSIRKVDMVFLVIVLALYFLGSAILIAGALTYGF